MNRTYRGLLPVFAIGALVAPLGDRMHVTTGTTSYHTDVVPFVWGVPVTFPLMVGAATLGLAAIRRRLGASRPGIGRRHAIGAVAAVMATYAVSATVSPLPNASPLTATCLVAALAVLTGSVLGDRPALICGLLAAVAGTVVEIVGVAFGLFDYAGQMNSLAGVAPWLPALYFGFGVAAAVLAEATDTD